MRMGWILMYGLLRAGVGELMVSVRRAVSRHGAGAGVEVGIGFGGFGAEPYAPAWS
jgi:hypothetical protein